MKHIDENEWAMLKKLNTRTQKALLMLLRREAAEKLGGPVWVITEDKVPIDELREIVSAAGAETLGQLIDQGLAAELAGYGLVFGLSDGDVRATVDGLLEALSGDGGEDDMGEMKGEAFSEAELALMPNSSKKRGVQGGRLVAWLFPTSRRVRLPERDNIVATLIPRMSGAHKRMGLPHSVSERMRGIGWAFPIQEGTQGAHGRQSIDLVARIAGDAGKIKKYGEAFRRKLEARGLVYNSEDFTSAFLARLIGQDGKPVSLGDIDFTSPKKVVIEGGLGGKGAKLAAVSAFQKLTEEEKWERLVRHAKMTPAPDCGANVLITDAFGDIQGDLGIAPVTIRKWGDENRLRRLRGARERGSTKGGNSPSVYVIIDADAEMRATWLDRVRKVRDELEDGWKKEDLLRALEKIEWPAAAEEGPEPAAEAADTEGGPAETGVEDDLDVLREAEQGGEADEGGPDEEDLNWREVQAGEDFDRLLRESDGEDDGGGMPSSEDGERDLAWLGDEASKVKRSQRTWRLSITGELEMPELFENVLAEATGALVAGRSAAEKIGWLCEIVAEAVKYEGEPLMNILGRLAKKMIGEENEPGSNSEIELGGEPGTGDKEK